MQSGDEKQAHDDKAFAPRGTEHAERLFSEQVRLLYEHVPIALLGLLLNALVLTYVLWDVTDHATLLIWLGAILASGGGRAVLRYRYRRGAVTPARAARWSAGYLVGTLASGLVWGLAGIFLFPPQSIVHQVFIAFLAGGLSAGSLAAYSAVAWMAPAFFLPALGILSARFLWQGDEISLIMGAMIALYIVLISFIARGMHMTTRTSLRLRQENSSLIAHLTEAKTHAERLNEELNQKIQQRTEAEQALRKSEEKFRGLVENATDGIALVQGERIQYANRAVLEMIGCTEEEAYAQPIVQVMPDTNLGKNPIYQRYREHVAGKDVPSQFEAQLKRVDGTVIDVILSSALIHMGSEDAVLIMVKDITERKRAESELVAAKETAEEATRRKDQFVSLVIHDLRAPLNSVFGMVSLLSDDKEHPLSAEQAGLLKLVLDRGESATRMIDDLLQISQLHTGKIKLEPKFVDGAAIADKAIRMLHRLAVEKEITITNSVPSKTRLYADPELLGKVICNLLSNAIKFSGRGGAICVFVPEGRPTTIGVRDSGVGIKPDMLPDLFKHEVKTALPGTAGERGAGWGLPMSRDIMQAMGGDIATESAEDMGSTFYVTLPRIRPKVLVVGKDESLNLFVQPLLDGIDADYLISCQRDEAIAHLENDGLHLVIVENESSDNDNGSLLQKVKERVYTKSVPVILIVDKSDSMTTDKALRLGADDIILKPLVPSEFIVTLRRYIA